MREDLDKIYSFIRDFRERTGTNPTVGEIAKGTGRASKGSTWYMLQKMEGLGLIKRDPSKWRSIMIQDPIKCHECGRYYEKD